MADVTITRTAIPGLLVVDLPVHEDARGWFKENWNRARMREAGFGEFEPVQHNVSFNARRGTTRGIHAEPWDKLVSVATGRVFAAWVDLREGESFGTVFSTEIDPSRAVFVPRGVGNSYQSLVDATAYTYLVNDHWRPGLPYPAVDLADPALGIEWPVPLAEAEMSEKDRSQNPLLADVAPMAIRRPLILGAGGQVGRALAERFPDAVGLDRAELDLSDPAWTEQVDWRAHDVVINAAAYTAVDAAETAEGRAACWQLNATVPAQLARVATEFGLTVVHFSSDYVFDGTREVHDEREPLTPLGVYGQAKAAGDLGVSATPRHYLLRTSWVVGDGHNFVRTMAGLAERGVEPTVVDDQRGRLTFADELARAVEHLLAVGADYGIYQVSSDGEPTSWAELAQEIYRLCGAAPSAVTPVTTAQYAAGRELAPRPTSSVLDLHKIKATGFAPVDQLTALRSYLGR